LVDAAAEVFGSGGEPGHAGHAIDVKVFTLKRVDGGLNGPAMFDDGKPVWASLRVKGLLRRGAGSQGTP
jgi:hypothetical protein